MNQSKNSDPRSCATHLFFDNKNSHLDIRTPLLISITVGRNFFDTCYDISISIHRSMKGSLQPEAASVIIPHIERLLGQEINNPV